MNLNGKAILRRARKFNSNFLLVKSTHPLNPLASGTRYACRCLTVGKLAAAMMCCLWIQGCVAPEPGQKPVHQALGDRDRNRALTLIKSGALDKQVDVQLSKVTALYLASSQNFYEVAQELINRGASPNVKCEHGRTPVHAAAHVRATATLKILLDNGGDVHVLARGNPAYRSKVVSPLDWSVAEIAPPGPA